MEINLGNQNNSKNNEGLIKLLCYVGICVLLIFIICPPLFRVLFPEEKQIEVEEEQKEIVKKLNCVKTESFAEYELKTTINSIYTGEKISQSNFVYEIKFNNEEIMNDEIIIDEYEKLKRVSNVDFTETDNKYVLNINYELFDYTNEVLLIHHRGEINNQFIRYVNNLFECKIDTIQ